MKSSTYMSVIDKYLSRHAKGEMITQKMLVQNCRLTPPQASRYVAYCIRIGLGKRTLDGLGLTAFSYSPGTDQRTRTINWREDKNNVGKKRGKKHDKSYVKEKLAEFVAAVPPTVPPPEPKPYVPPQVYAADPVMLEKLDTIASSLNHLSNQLETLINVWN